jgi:hypothetical protein
MKPERKITKRDEKGRVLEYTFLVDGKEVPQGQRYCKACSTIKDISLFSTNCHTCKDCSNARSREYYAKVKHDAVWIKDRNERVNRDGLEKKQRAVDYLGGVCNDCGGKFPLSVYDFHHLDPTEKEHNLGNILRRKNFSEIEKELSKCVLLCANCHRIRHFEGGKNEVK